MLKFNNLLVTIFKHNRCYSSKSVSCLSGVFLNSCMPCLLPIQRRIVVQNKFITFSNITRLYQCYSSHQNTKTIEDAITAFATADQKISISLLEEILSAPQLHQKVRLKYVHNLWGKYHTNGVLLDEEHFMLRLKCYLQCKHKISPKLFMNEVKNAGFDPSESILKSLLAVVAEHGDLGYVASVVTSMKSRNIPADDYVFGSLIIAHAVNKDMKNAFGILDVMNECHIKPGSHVYTALMRAAAMSGDIGAFLSAKTMANDSKIEIAPEQFLNVFETALTSGNQHMIDSMQSDVAKCSTTSLATLQERLVFNSEPVGAYTVFKCMINGKEEGELVKMCNNFVLSLFAAETPINKILDVCSRLVSDNLNERAFYDVLEVCLKNRSVEDCLLTMKCLTELKIDLRPHFFWPLFLASYRTNSDAGIYAMLEEMVSLNVEIDSDTLTEIVLPRLTLDESEVCLLKLRDVTNLPLSRLLGPYLSQLIKNGRLKEGYALCNRHQKSVGEEWLPLLMRSLLTGYHANRDHMTTAKLMKLWRVSNVGGWLISLLDHKKWLPSNDVTELLKEVRKYQMSITPAEEKWLNVIISRRDSSLTKIQPELQKLVETEQALPTTVPVMPHHPSQMNIEQLECHVKELESKNMNARGALRRLLQACCRAGNVEGAKSAYTKLKDRGMVESPGILSSMLEVYTRSRLFVEAEQVLKEIQKKYPQFRIDAYKILDLATLLINDGREEDALRVLESHPQKQTTVDRMMDWDRNCWELLSAAGKLHDPALVERFLRVMIKLQYCQPTNRVLGPLIKARLDSGNAAAAVKEFCYFAKNYKMTPLQQELILAALTSGDTSLLEEILTAATEIHGPDNTLATLIVSMALLKDTTGLTFMLKENKIDLKNAQLRSQLERACLRGQVAALECLLDVTSSTPNCDNDYLISLILQHYYRKGDRDSTLAFYEHLKESGIPISEKNKSTIATHIAAESGW